MEMGNGIHSYMLYMYTPFQDPPIERFCLWLHMQRNKKFCHIAQGV